VTTEHMHHEHSDVDTSVVEYPSALETTINSTTNETATSVEAYGEGDIPSPKLTAPAPRSEKADQEAPDSQEVLSDFVHETAAPLDIVSTSVSFSDNQDAPTELSPAPTMEEDAVSGTIKEEQQVQEITDIPEILSSADPQEETVSGAVLAKTDVEIINFQQKLAQLSSLEQESQEQSVTETPPDNASGHIEAVPAELVAPFIVTETEEKPLLETKAEEIRPFTDFIEEFRLAEVARLQTTLHESQVETFTLLSSVESAFVASNAAIDSADSTEEASNSIAQSEQSISTPSVSADEVSASSLRVDENGSAAPTMPEERAVSPLLRPAARLRVPRHGSGRHHREEQAVVAETSALVQSEQIGQITPSEPPVVPTPPKPARRYRFDRPSPATTVSTSGTNGVYGLNGSVPAKTSKSTTSQPFAEETRSGATLAVDLALIEEQAASEITQPIGQPIYKPTAAQETVSVENTSVTTTSPSEQGRRRHAQKEQPTVATPVTQVDAMPIIASVPTVEPDVQLEEIAPEDLPPLEYADLQKAHPRRRRRHRSGSNGNTSGSSEVTKSPAAPVVPPTPQQQTLMPQIPSTPVPPSVSASSYSIVSGYTVSQMNQGNDVAGPFMGPEPSPARGSAFTRDGRTTARPGSQRTPAAPVPTSRVGDNGLTSASITQFATIVSQAIEAQTDRMVAEFRRLGQAPTNVSVSLPPFPSSERVGVFVDVANLLYSARTLRIAVDFGKLLDFLRGNRRLIRAHAYCPTSPQPGDEQMFLQAVKGLGYRITTKNYKTFSSGAKKADLDLDLCMDVVRLVDGKAVDCIVLLSGDSDFMPMLDYCSDHGVRVEVAAFDEAMSATLRQSCDLFINLSMLEEIRA